MLNQTTHLIFSYNTSNFYLKMIPNKLRFINFLQNIRSVLSDAFLSSIIKTLRQTIGYHFTCRFSNKNLIDHWAEGRWPNALHFLANVTKQKSHNLIPTPTKYTPDQHIDNSNNGSVHDYVYSIYVHDIISTYPYTKFSI